jgi:hypothetical protein
VEANFHFIRNSGGWHFRWDFAISFSARTDKAIVSLRRRASRSLVPSAIRKLFGAAYKDFART